MKTNLDLPEIIFYFFIWSWSNVYSLCHLFMVQEGLLHEKEDIIKFNERDNITDGWEFISRKKDISDIEWQMWKYYISFCYIPIILHFIGSQLIRCIDRSLLPYWNLIFTIGVILKFYGICVTLFILYQPILFLLILNLKKCMSATLALWAVSLLNLIAINYLKASTLIWDFIDKQQYFIDDDVYLLFNAASWIQIRCLSYCLDHVDAVTNRKILHTSLKSHVINVLNYSLYFPTLFMGPIILYSDYERSHHVIETKLTKRIKVAIPDLLIVMVHSFLKELSMHYIYLQALSDDSNYISMLPSMALCGAGLWMGVQFHLKYVVTYGTGSALARLDHIEAPPTPRCVLRIHLYSKMWKHFDVGLYKFLIKYIYKPVAIKLDTYNMTKLTKRLLAALPPFVFILIWHDSTLAILVWAMLNYLGITLEYLGTIVQKTEMYVYLKKYVLKTNKMEERFLAFVSTPLLLMSALSNFYLFTDFTIGNIFVTRFFSEPFYNLLFIYFCLYTCCSVSAVLSDVPSRTEKLKEC